jgi:hypothetical protein
MRSDVDEAIANTAKDRSTFVALIKPLPEDRNEVLFNDVSARINDKVEGADLLLKLGKLITEPKTMAHLNQLLRAEKAETYLYTMPTPPPSRFQPKSSAQKADVSEEANKPLKTGTDG